MPRSFSVIGLIGKYQNPGVAETVRQLHRHLIAQGRQVLLETDTAEHIRDHGMTVATREEIGECCDLAIIVGGDGTLLNAARTLSDYGVPLVGINLGRLGFLVDVSPDEMLPRLDEILGGRYIEEERMLLHARVERDGQLILACDALNDVVVHKRRVARMIEVDTFINGSYVHTHRSDGLIVSTPTGSTAYALSGGGPILHPELAAVVLVPVCPHTLTHRPVVINADHEIELVVRANAEGEAQVTCDGRIYDLVEGGDRVKVRAKERRLRLLHPQTYDYFEILRTKLMWAENP